MDETDIQVHIQDNTMYKTAKVSGDVVYNNLFYHVDDDVLPDPIYDQQLTVDIQGSIWEFLVNQQHSL